LSIWKMCLCMSRLISSHSNFFTFSKIWYLHGCCACPTIWQNSQDVTRLIL
jgi:hypothetical protein